MVEELNFDSLALIEVPVSIAGKKYVLREASEATAAAYRNASIAGAKVEDGKLTEMPSNLAGVQSLLVARCLFPLDDEDKARPTSVSQVTVNNWPARIVKPLFEKTKEISELDEDESIEELVKQRVKLDERIAKLQKDSAKNEQEATKDG